MTSEEINRTIHEARGLCWHEVIKDAPRQSPCVHCHRPMDVTHVKRVGVDIDWIIRINQNPSYTSNWSDYGSMLEWAMKQEWWIEFLCFCVKDTPPPNLAPTIRDLKRIHGDPDVPSFMLNPLTGSTAIAKFIVANPQFFVRS